MSAIKRKLRAAEMVQWVSVHAASTREPEIRFWHTLNRLRPCYYRPLRGVVVAGPPH